MDFIAIYSHQWNFLLLNEQIYQNGNHPEIKYIIRDASEHRNKITEY